MPLKSFNNSKESLIPVFDVFLNKFQEIWVFNSDLKRNIDLDNWEQLRVQCPRCGWQGVERLVGEGNKQHFVEIDRQKLLKESYKAMCPYCRNTWEIEITREFNPKTLALSIDDDLNEGLTELDEELKESGDNK